MIGSACRHLPCKETPSVERAHGAVRAPGEIEDDGMGVQLRISKNAAIAVFRGTRLTMLEGGDAQIDGFALQPVAAAPAEGGIFSRTRTAALTASACTASILPRSSSSQSAHSTETDLGAEKVMS